MHYKHHRLHFLPYALAASFGAILGMLFAPKAGGEIRKDIADKAQDLSMKFKERGNEIREHIEDIFGEFSEALEENYLEMRTLIMAKIEEAKDEAALSQRRYDHIVDDIVGEFSKAKRWSKDAAQRLKKDFKTQWEDFKGEL